LKILFTNFYQTSFLNQEVNCTDPTPQLAFPAEVVSADLKGEPFNLSFSMQSPNLTLKQKTGVADGGSRNGEAQHRKFLPLMSGIGEISKLGILIDFPLN
jgi:hypothetical protein